MKKLEKIDGELFESLKLNEIKNLSTLKGGDVMVTKGTTQVACGNTYYSRSFTDKRNYHMDEKKGQVFDGDPYEFKLEFVINPNLTDQSTVSAEATYVDEL